MILLQGDKPLLKQRVSWGEMRTQNSLKNTETIMLKTTRQKRNSQKYLSEHKNNSVSQCLCVHKKVIVIVIVIVKNTPAFSKK